MYVYVYVYIYMYIYIYIYIYVYIAPPRPPIQSPAEVVHRYEVRLTLSLAFTRYCYYQYCISCIAHSRGGRGLSNTAL